MSTSAMDTTSIFVRDITKSTFQTHTVELSLDTTISGLKQKLEDKTTMKMTKMLLSLNGRYLKDDKSLSDYGIQADTTLVMNFAWH